jgi:transposase
MSEEVKTDKVDSIKLADLLRGGYIAECYVPTKETMDLRELVRHRAALVRMRPSCLYWHSVVRLILTLKSIGHSLV